MSPNAANGFQHGSSTSLGSITGAYGRTGSTQSLSPASPDPNSKTMSGARIMDKKWEEVQKKTFTKWVNMQLEKGRIEPIQGLSEDFSDGVKLIQLLEIIGDEPLGKYYKAPKMRIQKCENVNRALEFIKTRGVSLTNIGAEDLVDKNEKLVLGMIWTIILRFSISDINEEGLTAKEGLLLWCQRKTAGYKNVNVKDFTFSWQDGLALCALIHKHRPDLLNFDKLSKSNKRENVTLALEVAAKHLNIPKLFDPEDLVDITKPDERSVITYVAQYFHAFSALDKFEVAGRRVGKFAATAKAAWEMQFDYEERVKKLLAAINEIKESWAQATFDDSFADAKTQSNDLQTYKSTLKREWVTEKRELDTLLGNIQTKLSTYNLCNYVPPEGLSVEAVDQEWSGLLESEGRRRKAINEKLQNIKENLRRKYSDLANKFESDLNALSLELGSLSGDLDGQIEAVKQFDGRIRQLESRLSSIRQVDAECEEAGLDDSDREHTVFSYDDLVFDLGIVQQSIKKKVAFLQNQAVARKMTNVTAEQLEQFESTFKAFDKDQSNTLQAFEFKAVLASLGQHYADEAFDEIFLKVSQGQNCITFEQFTNFMISITEDKPTPEQLLQSFEVMDGGKGYLTEVDLHTGQVPADEIEFLKTVLPPFEGVEGGFDYKAYVKAAFK